MVKVKECHSCVCITFIKLCFVKEIHSRDHVSLANFEEVAMLESPAGKELKMISRI